MKMKRKITEDWMDLQPFPLFAMNSILIFFFHFEQFFFFIIF